MQSSDYARTAKLGVGCSSGLYELFMTFWWMARGISLR
jgi:hypothetical protein